MLYYAILSLYLGIAIEPSSLRRLPPYRLAGAAPPSFESFYTVVLSALELTSV
ncbi:MAG: hypothetical protein QXD46_06620 [Thermofilum sp.]